MFVAIASLSLSQLIAAGRATSDAAGDGGAWATSGTAGDDGVASSDGGLAFTDRLSALPASQAAAWGATGLGDAAQGRRNHCHAAYVMSFIRVDRGSL
jgi:hypothetical protein